MIRVLASQQKSLREAVRKISKTEGQVYLTMKNDRLSSLGLMHIHRDCEVDLYKAMEVLVSAKTRRADF